MSTSRSGRALLMLLLAAAMAAGLIALVGTKPAKATFPGQKGAIAQMGWVLLTFGALIAVFAPQTMYLYRNKT